MKLPLAIIAFSLIPALAIAQQRPTVISEPRSETDSRQAQIQAAAANGVAALREQVLHTRLGRDGTVGDFLDRAKATDELNPILESAQPVGGPRWVDEHVCQVKVELPAAKVSAFLMSVAKDETRHAGMKPDALKSKLAEWKDLKFTGTGTSAGGDEIDQARPGDSAGKWSDVSDRSRKTAISQAHADALQQVMQAIKPISLDGKKTVADVLGQPVVSQHVSRWLKSQPVTKIEFLENLKVSVTVSVTPKSLGAEIKSAVLADNSLARGLAVDWSAVNAKVESLSTAFTGSATAEIAGPGTSLSSVVLPLTPSDPLDQQLEAEGVATVGSSRLKTGLAAQEQALANLREKFLQLHIDPGTTLGDAARKDQALEQAIDRALKHARTTRADYHADGSVRVKISLDVRDAWDELRANP